MKKILLGMTVLFALAAVFLIEGGGLVDTVQGGRSCDNNGNGADTNISIFPCLGQDPADPLRFLFNGPYYIDYLADFITYEIMACGGGDYDGDGDAATSVLSC